ncbi:MAG: hypothetical protein ABIE55_00710 [Candidatus Aenigmatarchaeota archaeon]
MTVPVINPFKDLGKCFYFPVETTEGFLSGTELAEFTAAPLNKIRRDLLNRPRFYNPNDLTFLKHYMEGKKNKLKILPKEGVSVAITSIHVGPDYKGPLELPPGTECIKIYDLESKDYLGVQVIHYCHRFKGNNQEETSFIPFKNEMRSAHTAVKIEDFGIDEDLIDIEDSFSTLKNYW